VPLYADVKVNKGLSSSVYAFVRGDLPPYIGTKLDKLLLSDCQDIWSNWTFWTNWTRRMARRIRDKILDSRDARRDLKPRAKPYWRLIGKELHLGYRKGKRGGVWVLRRYQGEHGSQTKAFAMADDTEDANGTEILDFWHSSRHEAISSAGSRGRSASFPLRRLRRRRGGPAARYRAAATEPRYICFDPSSSRRSFYRSGSWRSLPCSSAASPSPSTAA
jgi:hypothetical protein